MRARALFQFAVLVFACRAFASTHVWTGGASGQFSDPANWSGGTPANDPSADLSFPVGSRLVLTNDLAGLTVHSIDFSGGGYTIAGNAITLTAAAEILDTSMGPNAVSCDLVLSDVTRITNSNTKTLTLSGALSGAGGIEVTGGGVLILTGPTANTYTGLTHVLQGELQLRKPPNTAAVPADLTIEGTTIYVPTPSSVSAWADEQVADTAHLTVSSAQFSTNGNETIGPITIRGVSNVYANPPSSGTPPAYRGLVLNGDIDATMANGNTANATMCCNLFLPATRTIAVHGSFYGLQVSKLAGASGAGLIVATDQDANASLVGTWSGPTTAQGPGAVAISDPNTEMQVVGGTVTTSGIYTYNGSVASLTMQAGTLNASSYLGGVTSRGDLRLAPGVTVKGDFPTPNPIRLNGTLDLAGAQLDTTTLLQRFNTSPGAVHTLIDNASATPVVGTFAGLPEGTVFNNAWKLSYVGGDGNDVTITEVGRVSSTVGAYANPTQANMGDPISIYSYVYVNPSSIIATGTMTFSLGSTTLATVPLVNGGATLTTSSLPPGYDNIMMSYSGDATVLPSHYSYAVSVIAPTPVLTSIQPSTVPGGTQGVTLVITGSNFVDGSTVLINYQFLPATFVSSTELHVTFNAPSPATDQQYSVTIGSSNSLSLTVTGVGNPPPPPPSQIMFTDTTVSANVTPGAMTAWLAETRRYGGYITTVATLANVITDADNDGLVTWTLDAKNSPVAPAGLWLAMDLSAKTILAGDKSSNTAPPPMPFASKSFLHDSAGNYSHFQLPMLNVYQWSLLWARPGVGAWIIPVIGDGYSIDEDGANNGLIVFEASLFQPVGSSPPAPAGVQAGDMFLAADAYEQQSWWGGLVDDHLAESIGGGKIQLVQTVATANEQAGVFHVKVLRTGGSDGTVSVQYATSDGTAIAGTNYQAQAGTLTFGDGEILKTIDIPLINDSVYSGTTAFTLTLSNPAGTTIDGAPSVDIQIHDDDPMPVVSVQAPVSVPEGDTGSHDVAVDVSLQGATRKAVTVSSGWYEGSDSYNAHYAQLVFATGETHKTITVSYTANTIPEPDRIITVFINSPIDATIGTGQSTVTITDDDFAVVSIADASVSKTAGAATLRLTPSVNSQKPITISYSTQDGSATSGVDYVSMSGTVVVPANSTQASISIPVINDAMTAGKEWFAVNLTGVQGGRLGRSTGTVTILDNAVPAITSLAPPTGPSSGTTTVTIIGSGFKPGARVTFDGIEATNVVVTSATAITAWSPAHASGGVEVDVINPDGQIGTTTPGFGLGGYYYTSTTCIVTLFSTSAMFALPSSGTISIGTNDPGCGWMAVSNSPLIQITSGAIGAGNGAVSYSASNSGTVTIAGQTFVVTVASGVATKGDFDGDRKADILLRDANGGVGMWFMNGAAVSSGAYVGSTSGLTIVGTGDFNGDGKTDVLLRDGNGNVGIWLMNGSAIIGGGGLPLPLSYSIVGIGDFDGDGNSDILLRDSNGGLGMWLMNGLSIKAAGAVAALPLSYSIAGVGDFNNDGKADILIRDSSGGLGIWFMNGTAVVGGGYVGALPLSFSVPAVADFDGDGKADILLEDSNGGLGMWLMNGAAIKNGGFIASIGNLTVTAARDYNGDGKADILFRDVNGGIGLWMMNGTQISSGGFIGYAAAGYDVY